MKYLFLSLALTACGASFESELLEKGLTDAGTTDQDATFDVGSDVYDGGPSYDSVGDAIVRMVDSSPDGPGEATDGATPDATADTSQPLACPSNACTDYCLDLGKIDVCTDGKCGCL